MEKSGGRTWPRAAAPRHSIEGTWRRQGLFRMGAALLLASCLLATVFTVPSAAVSVRKSMVVSLAEQKLYCMENGRVVYVFPVSTGTGATPTPTGDFRILYHDYAHPVPKYPGTVCYYWMGFFEDYALHAWPTYNGVQGNYAGLGSPASHGCIRLHPDQAHIPYYWAPNGTPISIIPGRFQPPPQPIRGGHAAAAVREASEEWYFAEGYTGEGFDEYLVVLNPWDDHAVTCFDFMLPDGGVRPFTFTAAPHSRMTVHVDALPGLGNTDVSVRITSTRPVVAERAVYFEYHGKTGGHATAGLTQLRDRWYFAEGYTGEGFDEYLVVLNPGDDHAVTCFDFMLPDGGVRPFTFTAAPHSRMTVHVDALPGLGNTDVSVRITSTRPVVAERAVYFGYRECPGGHAELGRRELSRVHLLAEGYTSPFFDTWITIMNPGDADTGASVTFMKNDGGLVPLSLFVPAHSRATLKANEVPGLENQEFSLRVEMGEPCLVERVVYFNYPR
ncbi:MAG: L,D-transpeptidase [Actinobacteria bacterium]|nr:L,D-transpeptidase [Actinomycetota bacterium]